MPTRRKLRRPWTKADERQLRALSKDKTKTMASAIKVMKRTHSAIRQKAFTMGVSLKRRIPRGR
jgi:hypothetical protein